VKKLNKKAVVLLSGGLDSTLAVKLMLDQGIEVHALNLTSAFCTCTSKKKEGSCSESVKVAKEFDIPIKVVAKGLDYLEIVKKPKHGYGRAMNPCIDCRIYSFKVAKELMKEIGASFVVTGEVLDQRPMSQRRQIMKTIEKESGLEGLVVRPLCAKFLKPSLPEQEGILDTEKLLGIQGKSRKIQIELADQFNIVDYPCAAGGCRLTEKGYSIKLKDYLDHQSKYSMAELQLLRYGRHKRLADDCRVILGRDEKENEILKNQRIKESLFVEPEHSGPSALIIGCHTEQYTDKVFEMIKKHTSKKLEEYVFHIYVDNKEVEKKIA
jgi:tRNA U34 2-thiouridine synthase MnmA/TrmU